MGDPSRQPRNRALLAWYAGEKRSLPWRRTRDPYRILVSEVMLQQTQAARVVPFYEGFLARFPTVDALATASLRDVLSAWNGLGYNARARRLHETGKRISRKGWPDTVQGLEELPGVGPYTARAVACFSFGRHVVPVDTNVRRVLSRWHGVPLRGRELRTAAKADAGGTPPAAWAQAVMDLGAALCRPRAPRCGVCPVASWCSGPDVYVAPAPQSRFKGSRRQLRGAIVRNLLEGPATIGTLASETGFPGSDVREALNDLEQEGLVEASGAGYLLPG